jgi:hypothetical protein
MKPMRAALFILTLVPITACNCGEGPLTKTPPPDTANLDAGFVIPDAGTPTEGRILKFNGTSPVALYTGATPELSFSLTTSDGMPVGKATVMFMFQGTGGSVYPTSGQTDSLGNITTTFDADVNPGSGMLTATADLAQPVVIEIDVTQNPNTRLVLDVNSNTRIPVTATDALVYVGAQGTLPSCAQLLGTTTPPSPTFTAMFTALPGSQAWPGQMAGQSATAIATARSMLGGVIARACTENVTLSSGIDTHIVVNLDQNPPNFDGSYDVLLALDIGDTIPPPAGPIIVTITDILSDPAGWAVYQVLGLLDDNLSTDFVEWTPPGGTMQVRASFDDVKANPMLFPFWKAGRDAFDNFLRQQFGQPYITVTEIGGDIAHLVRNFEVGAGYTITATGTPNRVKVFEDWQAMVFQWQYGCPNGDLGCARREIDFTGPNARLAPTTATYGATIHYTPTTTPAPGEIERYTLALDSHSVDLRYGAVILIVLDQLVFPNLPAPFNGNNLTDVIDHIVDCASLAQQLSMALGGFPPPAVIEPICMSAIAAAATYVENQILMLDSSNGLVGGNSPNGGGQIVLVDKDLDTVMDTVESEMTHLSWSTGQMISTPITGAGRRRATHCHRDTDCPSPTLCSPIASYLKVRRVENDCRRQAGSTLGMRACTQNGDCASNLCFDPGTNNHICFSACYGAGSCMSGTCTSSAATVNLDAVLAGLGNAHDDACVP